MISFRASQLRCYVVLDPDMCGGEEGTVAVAEATIRGGATFLQLRAPLWHKKRLVELGRRLVALARPLGVPLVVDDHVDVAIAVGADGVHVGQRDMSAKDARQLMGRSAIIGLSISNSAEMEISTQLGGIVDYLGVGPVFAQNTKTDANPAIGVEGLRALVAAAQHPTVAIGGIKAENAAAVAATGVGGVAVVSAVCAAADPEAAARELVAETAAVKLWEPKIERPNPTTRPNVLTIAGSDSGGGAGVQADLRTFSALGAFGCSAFTVLTAQNTEGVEGIHMVPPEFVVSQIDAVLSDIHCPVVKLGAMGNEENIWAVAAALERWSRRIVVLDPVFVTTSGHRLLPANAVCTLRSQLLPKSTLITPNLLEAADLLGLPVAANEEEMIAQGRKLRSLGANAVLLKGGHLGGAASPDWLLTETAEHRFASQRIHSFGGAARNSSPHGTGCTLAAAVAAHLAHFVQNRENAKISDEVLIWAVGGAKEYLSGAIGATRNIAVGSGVSPVDHLWAQRELISLPEKFLEK